MPKIGLCKTCGNRGIVVHNERLEDCYDCNCEFIMENLESWTYPGHRDEYIDACIAEMRAKSAGPHVLNAIDIVYKWFRRGGHEVVCGTCTHQHSPYKDAPKYRACSKYSGKDAGNVTPACPDYEEELLCDDGT
jgi:hypothetical protein